MPNHGTLPRQRFVTVTAAAAAAAAAGGCRQPVTEDLVHTHQIPAAAQHDMQQISTLKLLVIAPSQALDLPSNSQSTQPSSL
jgi:hypothetical protein